MLESLQHFVPYIEEEYKRLGLFYNAHAAGLALHRVQFLRDSKSFSYQCVEADELFKRLMAVTTLDNFRYEVIFPQEDGSSRFDWSIVLGHANEFYSTSYFYCFSPILQKWIRFLVIGPKKGLALVAVEDITQKIATFPRPATSQHVE
ncbi:MAG: hypothetical protein ACP5PS_08925 [Bacteroidales bacterium]